MADQIPLKAVYVGDDLVALGEFNPGDVNPIQFGGTGAENAPGARFNLDAARATASLAPLVAPLTDDDVLSGYDESEMSEAGVSGARLWEFVSGKLGAIELTGDAIGTANFETGSVSIEVEVQDDSHAHIIGNVDGLQTALNAKSDDGHTHPYLPLAGGTVTGFTSFGAGLEVGGYGVSAFNHGANHDIYLTYGLAGKLYARTYNGTSYSSPYTVWHAGNDGPGSGCDADTVDGLQGNQFLRADADDSTTGYLEVYKGVYLGHAGLGDSMARFWDAGGAAWRALRWSQSESAWKVDDALGNQQVIWHSGNDGAGTGLHADLLDGFQGSQFLRSDAADSASGIISFAAGLRASSIRTHNGNEIVVNAGESEGRVGGQTGELLYVNAEGGLSVNTPDAAHSNWESGYSVNTTVIKGDSIRIGGQTVWHTGNDGSGSGLDADKVDGLQASSFLRGDANTTKATGYLRFNDNIQAQFGNDADMTIRSTNSNIEIDSNLHVYLDLNNDRDFFIRDANSSHAQAFAVDVSAREIYEGTTRLAAKYLGISAKAADAEKLDGINSTQFLRSDQSSTLTGILTVTDKVRIGAAGNTAAAVNFYDANWHEWQELVWNSASHALWLFTDDGSTTHIYQIGPPASDRRLKHDIAASEYGLTDIKMLRPVDFVWNDDQPNAGELDVSFIAQDVQKVIPEAVTARPGGMLALKELPLIAALVNAVKTLDSRLQVMETRH